MEGTKAGKLLGFHQEQGTLVVGRLKEGLEEQFDRRKVNPNASMGKALRPMPRPCKLLILFLRVPAALWITTSAMP